MSHPVREAIEKLGAAISADPAKARGQNASRQRRASLRVSNAK